jgi:hypothetical protein
MIGRKPISRAPESWLSAALSLSCAITFLMTFLAQSTIPALRKPVEPLLCDRNIVFVTSGLRGLSDERVVCPAEGSGIVYGVFRGERRDVTLPYYGLMALFYGACSFVLLVVMHYAFSRRRGKVRY